uniref:Nexin_C domain-containing protein n=1 Tax=Echinostoma caproni TaxID=27848 RepID=A0A183B920_9TREM
LAEFVAYLRDSVWPPTDPTQPTTQPGERAMETKMRTRVLCRTMLLGSVSEDLAQFLGNETTRRGVLRVFRLLQEERFNRRFVHFLLEAILCQLFRSHRAHWESLFEKQLCPTKTGRSCRAHATPPSV